MQSRQAGKPCTGMHAGIRDILLFRKFVPETKGEYAGAIILFMVVGVIASGLRTLRSVQEAAERLERNKVSILFEN
jgi:hypothetical protein